MSTYKIARDKAAANYIEFVPIEKLMAPVGPLSTFQAGADWTLRSELVQKMASAIGLMHRCNPDPVAIEILKDFAMATKEIES